MKKKINQIGYRLEALELAKIREEYEKNGFEFFENKREKIDERVLFLDAYAYNPNTKEEIIFEVKANRDFIKKDKKALLEQLKLYKNYFPTAKIILVTPSEVTPPKIKLDNLNEVLLRRIDKENKNILMKKIGEDSLIPTQVIKASFDEITSTKDIFLSITGSAHLKCLANSEPNEITYEIPFSFKLLIYLKSQFFLEAEDTYTILIEFDFFEFD
ncbi:hypothetical protein MM236_01960 [Belliella sp. DSM 107340]|uniref:Uncharacterized protein n=1 Tax=Belliella calami TaxID=2923436 RepID=A0ABS9UKG2_9BACT|nr:hypothetical protein [Belliella calami]MCH7396728.1 hypothetical protein [Belliella calami]